MPKNFSYPRVEDNSLVSPIQSISRVHIDPPNLPPLPPIDQTFPIGGRAFGFDAESDTHRMHPCVYPLVKDTCIVEHCPNTNAAMQDALVGSAAAESKDAIEFSAFFRMLQLVVARMLF